MSISAKSRRYTKLDDLIVRRVIAASAPPPLSTMVGPVAPWPVPWLCIESLPEISTESNRLAEAERLARRSPNGCVEQLVVTGPRIVTRRLKALSRSGMIRWAGKGYLPSQQNNKQG